MKYLLLTVFIFLLGCGTFSTLRTVTKTFMEDPTVKSEDKKEVILETTRIKETYRQYRMYHYAALALGAFGLASVAFNVTSTKVGLGSIGGAVVLSAWATYAPANQGKIGWALGGLALSVGGYIIKKLVIDKLLTKKG